MSLLFLTILGGCGSNWGQLDLRQFHLRDTEVRQGNEYVRAEVNKRLYGAVTRQEREERLGQYYTVEYRGLDPAAPATIELAVRRASGGAKVTKYRKEIQGEKEGKVEFTFTGDEYRKRGRVVAWLLTLSQGGRVIEQEQSYLWE